MRSMVGGQFDHRAFFLGMERLDSTIVNTAIPSCRASSGATSLYAAHRRKV
jgi:hypothetical protein